MKFRSPFIPPVPCTPSYLNTPPRVRPKLPRRPPPKPDKQFKYGFPPSRGTIYDR